MSPFVATWALRIVGPLLVVALVWLHGYSIGRSGERQAHDAERLAAEQEAREEEFWRTTRLQEVQDHAHVEIQAAHAAARAADTAAGQLRERLAAFRRTYPSTAGGGPATADAIGMLADVLERADRRAGDLAAYADATRIAGIACERAYDALSGEALR